MKLVCAWCGVAIDRPGYSWTIGGNMSHGMCSACSQSLASQERGVTLQRHIDGIPVPILLVDDKDAVVTMNAKAGEILGNGLHANAEQFFGQVFDCVHSRQPDGCGGSIHCSGCLIRRSVTTTFETGDPQIRVPATLSVETPDGILDAVLAVTTVKRDGIVLLRVEKR